LVGAVTSFLIVGREMIMPRTAAANMAMVDQVATAIAMADGHELHTGPTHYRDLALAALKPLTQPTEAMIDAAHEAVWSNNFWAINSRRDFKKAVRAMILAAMREDDIAGR
jgi:hypothetical protein